jgi:hypothetical protein
MGPNSPFLLKTVLHTWKGLSSLTILFPTFDDKPVCPYKRLFFTYFLTLAQIRFLSLHLPLLSHGNLPCNSPIPEPALIIPEDGGSTLLQNICTCPQNYSVISKKVKILIITAIKCQALYECSHLFRTYQGVDITSF